MAKNSLLCSCIQRRGAIVFKGAVFFTRHGEARGEGAHFFTHSSKARVGTVRLVADGADNQPLLQPVGATDTEHDTTRRRAPQLQG